nr:hypothetical protein [uncultured Cohaesibacter sp.]
MAIDYTARDSEIRFRHTQHGNSPKTLARFYDISIDEIKLILSHPPLPEKDGRPREPMAKGGCFEDSVAALKAWICKFNGISEKQLLSRQSEEALNARRMLAYNLRIRWGLDWHSISSIVGYQQMGCTLLLKACDDRQEPPCSPPDPDLPRDYLTALRRVAERHGVTPHAVLNGSAQIHQRAKLSFFQYMAQSKGLTPARMAKATGFSAERVVRILNKAKEAVR